MMKNKLNEKDWYREKIIKMARETRDLQVLKFIFSMFHETLVRRGDRNAN